MGRTLAPPTDSQASYESWPRGHDSYDAWAAGSEGPVRQQAVELGVAGVDPDVHAAGEHPVAGLVAVEERLDVQPGASVAQLLEGHRLQCHAVGVALEGEGLH